MTVNWRPFLTLFPLRLAAYDIVEGKSVSVDLDVEIVDSLCRETMERWMRPTLGSLTSR